MQCIGEGSADLIREMERWEEGEKWARGGVTLAVNGPYLSLSLIVCLLPVLLQIDGGWSDCAWSEVGWKWSGGVGGCQGYWDGGALRVVRVDKGKDTLQWKAKTQDWPQCQGSSVLCWRQRSWCQMVPVWLNQFGFRELFFIFFSASFLFMY